MKVGKVESLALEHGAVTVEFRVSDAFVGDQSEAAIKIETVLGAKYLALVPRGSTELDPDKPIPVDRTASPYDVVEAFADLSTTVEQLDTTQLANSFEVLSQTFANTPEEVRTSLQGLARLSDTISSRDAQLGQLLSATRQVSQVLADRNGEFTQLIVDSNTLLTEVQRRRELIDSILTSTQELSQQLSGLVADNRESLTPALQQLSDGHRHPVPQPGGARPRRSTTWRRSSGSSPTPSATAAGSTASSTTCCRPSSAVRLRRRRADAAARRLYGGQLMSGSLQRGSPWRPPSSCWRRWAGRSCARPASTG